MEEVNPYLEITLENHLKIKGDADRLRELLRICAKNYYCPVCRGSKHYKGHKSDCKLAKELADD